MVLESSAYHYLENELTETEAETPYMLSYTYTDIDTDRIESPRIISSNHQVDNVVVVDKSNVYFSDYTPIDAISSRAEPPSCDFSPNGRKTMVSNLIDLS